MGPGRGRGGAWTGLSLGPCGRPCLRAAQPRDSFASWNTGACAPHSRRGGRGAGGFLAAAVGTETVEVPSSALLAQIAAHVFESHPSSGQLGWVGALELAEEGDTLSVKGLALFQASLGPHRASLSRPVCGLAWPQRPAVHSFLLPTCWVEQCEDSFLRPDISLMGGL